MIRLLLGGLGFFALLAAALWFGLSGIPAGDSRNRKDAETNAHGRREFLFDDAQDFDDEPRPLLTIRLDNRDARFIPSQPSAPYYRCTCAERGSRCLVHWPFKSPL